MTCDERLEALLNRAGQTVSDLPKAGALTFAHSVNNPHTMLVVEKAIHDYEQFGYAEYDSKSTDDYRMAIDYILHLSEIIDRFEWALENTCNERDYLAYRLRRYIDCLSCERTNECERTPDHCLGWVFGGVPDGSVDDDADTEDSEIPE